MIVQLKDPEDMAEYCRILVAMKEVMDLQECWDG